MEQLKEFPEEGCFYAKSFIPLLVKYLESLGGVPKSAYSLKVENSAGVAWGLDNQGRIYYWYLKGQGSKKPRYTYEQLQPFLTKPEQASFGIGDVFTSIKDHYNFKKGGYYYINALGPNNSYCLNDGITGRWISIQGGFYTFFKQVENQRPATVNQHGLEVGMEVTEKQLNDWVASATAKYTSNHWSRWSNFHNNRQIRNFVRIANVDCFRITGTTDDVYIKAEGFLDFINKDKPVKEDYKFEVGKWYYFTTVNGTYKIYVKAGVIESGCLTFENKEYICDGKYDNTSSGIYLKSIENPRLVTDLSEIQEFLPEGHVDKKYQPKAGDWVVITGLDARKLSFISAGNNSSRLSVGDVVQLVEKAEQWSYGDADKNHYWWRTSKDKRNGIVSVLFRKAEAHEIPSSDKPIEWKVGDAFEVIKDNPSGSLLRKGKVYHIYSITETGSLCARDLANVNMRMDCGSVMVRDIKKPETVKAVELSNDELLKMAIEKYPVGTVYKVKYKKENVKVKGTLKICRSREHKPFITDGWGGAVYEDGEWAEIVSSPKSNQIPEDDIKLWPKAVEVNDSVISDKGWKALVTKVADDRIDLFYTQREYGGSYPIKDFYAKFRLTDVVKIPGGNKMNWDRLVEVGDKVGPCTFPDKPVATVSVVDLSSNRIVVELNFSKARLSRTQEEFYNEYALFQEQIPEVKKAEPLYVLGNLFNVIVTPGDYIRWKESADSHLIYNQIYKIHSIYDSKGNTDTHSKEFDWNNFRIKIEYNDLVLVRNGKYFESCENPLGHINPNRSGTIKLDIKDSVANHFKDKWGVNLHDDTKTIVVDSMSDFSDAFQDALYKNKLSQPRFDKNPCNELLSPDVFLRPVHPDECFKPDSVESILALLDKQFPVKSVATKEVETLQLYTLKSII